MQGQGTCAALELIGLKPMILAKTDLSMPTSGLLLTRVVSAGTGKADVILLCLYQYVKYTPYLVVPFVVFTLCF